jgi:hypothetical protein
MDFTSHQIQEMGSKLANEHVLCNLNQTMALVLADAEATCKHLNLPYEDILDMNSVQDWQSPVEEFIANADLDMLESMSDEVGYWDDVVQAAKDKYPGLKTPWLIHYIVNSQEPSTGFEDELEFECWAETEEQAAEQCVQALPNSANLSVWQNDDDKDAEDFCQANPGLDNKIREALLASIGEDDWMGLAQNYDIDPYESEVYQHFAVDDWLAYNLKQHGAKVVEFLDFNVWCRTTCGQSVYMDWVFEQVSIQALREEQ